MNNPYVPDFSDIQVGDTVYTYDRNTHAGWTFASRVTLVTLSGFYALESTGSERFYQKVRSEGSTFPYDQAYWNPMALPAVVQKAPVRMVTKEVVAYANFYRNSGLGMNTYKTSEEAAVNAARATVGVVRLTGSITYQK